MKWGPREYRTLALDLGAITGFAWTDELQVDLRPDHRGVWDMRHADYRKTGLWTAPDAGEVFQRLWRNLDELRPGTVVYEVSRAHRGISAAQNYGAWVATVLSWGARHRATVVGIHSATLKRHATGNGHASKDQMMEAARRKLGWTGESDDEADAIWLLHALLAGVR